ncbi:K(+)-transporting ATPase subunit F [Salinicola rhizosphaerae]
MTLILLAVALATAVYLFVALCQPERF